MTQELEREWLLEAQSGDRAAFDLLTITLEPVLLRFTRRLVGSAETAEDVVQETFIVLYKNLDRIDPPEKLRPFLYRVARNRCYDLLRRQGRYDQMSLDEEPVQVRVSFNVFDSAQQAPDETTHWLLLLLEVREAMDQLPEAQRDTLILFTEEDMSHAEIAEVMDVNIGTVKSRLHHAKKTLRGLVRPETLLAITGGGAEPTDDQPEAPSMATGNQPEQEAVTS
ncbi:MAG: RNA polymerase sigma factor [Chloroflexota bacterium]